MRYYIIIVYIDVFNKCLFHTNFWYVDYGLDLEPGASGNTRVVGASARPQEATAAWAGEACPQQQQETQTELAVLCGEPRGGGGLWGLEWLHEDSLGREGQTICLKPAELVVGWCGGQVSGQVWCQVL